MFLHRWLKKHVYSPHMSPVWLYHLFLKKEKRKKWRAPVASSCIRHACLPSLNFLCAYQRESLLGTQGSYGLHTQTCVCVFSLYIYTQTMEPRDHSLFILKALNIIFVRTRHSKLHPPLRCISSARILASQLDCRPHYTASQTTQHKRSRLVLSTHNLKGNFREQRLVRT